MQRLRILIVGAGIAGTAAAALLSRRGHDVVVLERSEGARSSGSPVDIRGRAHDAVRRLGIESALRARDTGARTVAFVDARGRTITTVGLRPAPEDIEISRTDLAQVLLGAAGGAVELRYGETFTALAQGGAGVDVTLLSGGQERFDLVVGADGQRSATRHALEDAPGQAVTASTSLQLAIATVPLALDIVDPSVVRMHNEPGISLTVHPAGGRPGVAFIFRTAQAPVGHAARLRLLRAKYGTSGWRAREFLDALDGAPEEDVYFAGVQRVRARRWAFGRVVLLGDAAASLTILGNGSSLALTGAAVLDRALAEEPDIPAALARYEREHRPAAERAQRGASVSAGFLVPRTATGLGIRNLIARAMRTV